MGINHERGVWWCDIDKKEISIFWDFLIYIFVFKCIYSFFFWCLHCLGYFFSVKFVVVVV